MDQMTDDVEPKRRLFLHDDDPRPPLFGRTASADGCLGMNRSSGCFNVNFKSRPTSSIEPDGIPDMGQTSVAGFGRTASCPADWTHDDRKIEYKRLIGEEISKAARSPACMQSWKSVSLSAKQINIALHAKFGDLVEDIPARSKQDCLDSMDASGSHHDVNCNRV